MKALMGITALSAALLAGCASSPQAPRITPYMAESYTPSQICALYYRTKDPVLMAEMERRDLFNKPQRESIKGSKISRHMTKDAVRCAWGEPNHINTTITAGGSTEQWVYQRCSTCKMQFVYFQRGRVTAIQS